MTADQQLQELRTKKNHQIKRLQGTINQLKSRPIYEGHQKLADENKQLRRQIELQEIELERIRHENREWRKAFDYYQKEQNQ